MTNYVPSPGDYGPEFEAFVEDARENLVPKIEGTNLFVAITPGSPEKVDIKFAVELGLAIMYDKPILSIIPPGTKISEKLARVVDRFVELDMNQLATNRERLHEAINEMLHEEKGGST